MKCSVLLPCYNAAVFIEDAVESVLSQTYQNFELLIINDGSKDDTKEILRQYSDKANVEIIHFEENRGLISVLNTGIEIASGDILVRMDADDISCPNRLERLVRHLNNFPEDIVVGSWAKEFGKKSKIIRRPVDDLLIRTSMLVANPMIHPSVAIRMDVLRNNSIRFDRNYPHLEDYKFWMDLLPHGNFHNIPEPLILYRRHDNQVSKVHEVIQSSSTFKLRAEFLNKNSMEWISDIINPKHIDKRVTSEYLMNSFKELNLRLSIDNNLSHISADYLRFLIFRRLLIKALNTGAKQIYPSRKILGAVFFLKALVLTNKPAVIIKFFMRLKNIF